MPRYRYKHREHNAYLVVRLETLDPPQTMHDSYVLMGCEDSARYLVPRGKIGATWADVEKHMKHCEVMNREQEKAKQKRMTEYFADIL